MIEINGKSYDIQISLFCGNEKRAVDAYKDDKNATYLNPDNISELSIDTTLLTPYFKGYFDYDDRVVYSYIRKIVANPFIYGHITLALVDPKEQPGKAENDGYVYGEKFDETVIITGIDSMKLDGNNDYSNFRFYFESADSVNFSASMLPYSTVEKGEDGDKLDEVLNSVFAKAGLAGKADFSAKVPSLKIPFMTTCNMSLDVSLEYIYRKAFDSNVSINGSSSGFFKVIYDHRKGKYVIWSFDDIGYDHSSEWLKPNKDNYMYASDKYLINVNMDSRDSVGRDGVGIISIKRSGNGFDVMDAISDRKYFGYNYPDNSFTTKELKQFSKNNVHTHAFSKDYVLKTSIYDNSKLDKNVKFDKCYSRWRENAGVYDMYNDMIFGSGYVNIRSNGVIGRCAGDIIQLKCNEGADSPYNKFRGDYFLTSNRTVYTRENIDCNGAATLISHMDCYTPYMQTESNSEESTFVPC